MIYEIQEVRSGRQEKRSKKKEVRSKKEERVKFQVSSFKSRKSQISIFILIALVLVATIGIGIYILSSTKTIDTVKVEGLQVVEEYVKSCFQGYMDGGVEIVLSQGGRIYNTQGGINRQPTVLEYDGVLISYGITKLQHDEDQIKKTIPEYPWKDFPYIPIDIPGFENIKVDINNGRFIFGEVSIPSKDDVTNDIHSYISSISEKCFNFEQFASEGIVAGASTPTFMISLNPLDVELKVEVIINASKGEESKSFSNFRISVPVRMSGILDAAKSIATDDVTLLLFDPTAQPTITTSSEESFNVRINRNPVPTKNGDDIISIVDPLHLFRGSPTIFSFARENRPPALSRINMTFFENNAVGMNPGCSADSKIDISDSSSGGKQAKFTGTWYKGSSASGTNGWTEDLYAYDPDEDVVSLNITSVSPTTNNLKSTLTLNNGQKTFYITAYDGSLIDYQQLKEDVGVRQCS